MKGLILDQLLDFLRESAGENFVQGLLDGLELPSGGAYTSVGTYDSDELVRIVGAYCEATGTEPAAAVRAFGEWVFPKLACKHFRAHPDPGGTFGLLRILHGVIHVEVRKLYPDAELPEFETADLDPDRLEVRYRSKRAFADLAHGLIVGCANHYGERIEIDQQTGDAETVFTLTRHP